MAGGDAARGKTLFTPCSACHGPDGAGKEQVKAPPLNHASDWYLLAQLKKFKEGIRGGTPADIEGAQMRPMATALTDEQAMKDVVAHIATLRALRAAGRCGSHGWTDTETNPDSEARKWFTIAIVGAFLYVSTVFAFMITRDVSPTRPTTHAAPGGAAAWAA